MVLGSELKLYWDHSLSWDLQTFIFLHKALLFCFDPFKFPEMAWCWLVGILDQHDFCSILKLSKFLQPHVFKLEHHVMWLNIFFLLLQGQLLVLFWVICRNKIFMYIFVQFIYMPYVMFLYSLQYLSPLMLSTMFCI